MTSILIKPGKEKDTNVSQFYSQGAREMDKMQTGAVSQKGLTFFKMWQQFSVSTFVCIEKRQQRGNGYKDLGGIQPRVKEKTGISAIMLTAKALCQLIFQPII